MLFENISPFVRFATKQKLFTKKNLVNYDHRLYYCLNGEGDVKLNGKTFHLQPHSLLLWRAGTLYSYSKSDKSADFEIASCNFDYTRFSEHMATPVPPCNQKFYKEEKRLSKNDLFSDFTDLNDVVFIPDGTIIKDIIIELCDEFGSSNKFKRLKLNHLFTEIILNIATLISHSSNNSQTLLVQNVLSYLQTHYLEDAPSLSDLGKLFSYHPNHLNQLVSDKSGLTIHQHIIRLKMNKAMKYLMSTDLSVSEISEKIGILDTRYFSRIFKKTFGITPSSFRKNV